MRRLPAERARGLARQARDVEEAHDFVMRSDGIERTKDLAVDYSNQAVEAILGQDAHLNLLHKPGLSPPSGHILPS